MKIRKRLAAAVLAVLLAVSRRSMCSYGREKRREAYKGYFE